MLITFNRKCHMLGMDHIHHHNQKMTFFLHNYN